MLRFYVLVFFLLGCAPTACGSRPRPSDAPTFKAEAFVDFASDSGALRFALRTAPDQPPVRGVLTCELVVTDAAGAPVDGLTLAVQPLMIDMGHGTSTTPVVHAKGGGRYIIENVDAFMPGQWQLGIDIAGAVTDHATVLFRVL